MAIPHGKKPTEKISTNNVTTTEQNNVTTTEQPCPEHQIIGKNGICTNATERIFDIDFDPDCPNYNEIRNTHGDCISSEAIIIFD